jgi:predicted RNA-binding protein with TRAM domain
MITKTYMDEKNRLFLTPVQHQIKEDMSMFRDKGFQKRAPLEEGQELDVTIEAVGEKGDGIAKSKGFVIFVPGVRQGDQVRVRITKVLRNFSFGEVVGNAADSKPSKKQKAGKSSDEEPKEEFSENEKDEDFGDDQNKDEENFDDEERE